MLRLDGKRCLIRPSRSMRMKRSGDVSAKERDWSSRCDTGAIRCPPCPSLVTRVLPCLPPWTGPTIRPGFPKKIRPAEPTVSYSRHCRKQHAKITRNDHNINKVPIFVVPQRIPGRGRGRRASDALGTNGLQDCGPSGIDSHARTGGQGCRFGNDGSGRGRRGDRSETDAKVEGNRQNGRR